jgi:hypothetical protein
MKRTSSLLFVAVFACGGSSPPTTMPLPPENEAKPAEPEKPAPPPPPAPPVAKPIDLAIAAPQTTLKLITAGGGKKAVLKLAATQGAKQHLDLTLDFSGKQTAAPELGGTSEDTAPTVILASDIEVGEVGSDGTAKFTVTVSGQDAKDRAGAKVTAAQFKAEKMGDITGLTLAGSVGPNGQLGALAIHLDKADEKKATMVALLKLLMMPMWPQLPTDPIGVGAKWTVSAPFKIAERLDTTQTVDYEVVSHTGKTWEIKGTVKLAGADQKVDNQASFDKIGGAGKIAMTLTDDAFVPQSSSTLTSDFTANVTLPAEAGSAAGQTRSAQFHLEQGFAVAPK